MDALVVGWLVGLDWAWNIIIDCEGEVVAVPDREQRSSPGSWARLMFLEIERDCAYCFSGGGIAGLTPSRRCFALLCWLAGAAERVNGRPSVGWGWWQWYCFLQIR